MATQRIKPILKVSVILAVVLSVGVRDARAECVQNGAGTRRVCVEWSLGNDPPPEQGTDFEVDYLSEADPIVELLTADLEWVVYSEIISSGVADNIHLLTLDTTGSDDFEVTIAEGANPGAADVGSINLTDVGWTGFSSIDGGWIVNLTGNLILQREGTSGGEISGSFKINNDLSGDVLVPVITGTLSVFGEVSGDIDVTVEMDGGFMVVQELTSTGSVTIADMVNSSSIEMVFVDGTVIMENGIPAGQSLFISDLDGTLNLNGGNVAALWINEGSGSIIKGGAIQGDVLIANGGPGSAVWSGTATFASVAVGGKIRALAADVSGEVHITGLMDGLMRIRAGGTASGDLLDGGELSVGSIGDIGLLLVDGDALGDIVVVGEVDGGTVQIGGDVSGDLTIGDDLAGDILIGGTLQSAVASAVGRIFVEGLLTGDITIDEETQSLTLIRLTEGIDTGGAVIINKSRGNFDANGTIHVGPVLWFGDTPPDITFDGSIMIKDNASHEWGDLEGTIKVVGCHNLGDLDICIWRR